MGHLEATAQAALENAPNLLVLARSLLTGKVMAAIP